MCLACMVCIDCYIVKPECCSIESPLIRKILHGIATLVHLAILGISSAMIYFGTNAGGDLLLVIPYAISTTFLIMVLLCTICRFVNSTDVDKDAESNSNDVIEIEAIDANGDCSMFGTYAFSILLMMHGTILFIAQGGPPISARYC